MSVKPVFFTVHDGNGTSNPHSLLVLRELERQNNCETIILSDVGQINLIEKNAIAVFDSNRKVNNFSPILTSHGAPQWAACVSFGIKVGPACVQREGRPARAARQVVEIFSRPLEEIQFRSVPRPGAQLAGKRKRPKDTTFAHMY